VAHPKGDQTSAGKKSKAHQVGLLRLRSEIAHLDALDRPVAYMAVARVMCCLLTQLNVVHLPGWASNSQKCQPLILPFVIDTAAAVGERYG
jgi:hypothetical protein